MIVPDAGAAAAHNINNSVDIGAAFSFVVSIVDAGDVRYGDTPFQRLAALDPAGLAWAAWGRWLCAQGALERAVPKLRRAISLHPKRAQTWSDLANAFSGLKRGETALRAALRALVLAPDNADYLFNVACEQREADNPAAAAGLSRWALRMAPQSADAWRLAAETAVLLRRPESETQRLAHTAAALAPSFPAVINLLAALATRRNARSIAGRWFDRTSRIDPDFAESALHRAMFNLQNGDLTAGWRDYRRRFAGRGYADRQLTFPPWRGESLAGKRVLVWREQGVGDEILFSSCLPDLARITAQTTFECDSRLVSLFARSFPGLRCIATGLNAGGGDYDCHLPLGALSESVRPSLASFPATTAWLRPDPALVRHWRGRLDQLSAGLNVGLAWKSGLTTADRADAYTQFADWAGLLQTPGVNVINLQYGDCAAELAAAAGALLVWGDLDLKNDFEQVAALCANLDLVICPATAVGELAAAVGTPVWRLGGLDWTTLGSRVRPWYVAQRLLTPEPTETLGDVARRIPRELLKIAATPQAQVQTPPDHFDAALSAFRDGRADEAARLLTDHPTRPEARHLAAVIANRLGRHAQAARLLADRAARADAEPAEIATVAAALKSLGLAAADADQPAAALAHCRRALALIPADRAALINASAALIALRRANQASRTAHWATILDAADPDAWVNVGRALNLAQDAPGAMEAYRRALVANPRHGTAHYNLALLLLAQGAFGEGWGEHDWRFATPQFQGQGKKFPTPLWRGENIIDKRLLVWREQGVGDEIMFASCYGDVINRAGRAIIQTDKRLVRLLARSFPKAQIIADNAPTPPHDAHVPAGSLPRRLRPQLARFTAGQSAWLRPDPQLAALWRRRLDELGPGLKIGLAWRSRLISSERTAFYIDAADWAPVATTPGVRCVNLQSGDVQLELDNLRRQTGADVAIFDDLDLIDDFDGMAALMSQLDLILTPATSIGEMASAVGAPTWRLCWDDWTQLGTGARPWHPAMRLWRPKAGQNLRDVPHAMAAELARLAAADAGGRSSGSVSPSVARQKLAQAQARFVAGDMAAAARGFADIIAAAPDCAPAWAGVGACLADGRAFDGAIVALMRALALNPADAAALTTLGNAHFGDGALRAAVLAHDRATRTAPGLWPAWDNLGAALYALGQDGESESCCRKALSGDAAMISAWINLSAALRRQGRFTQARQALNNALALNPADGDAYANLSRLLRLTVVDPLRDPWAERIARLIPNDPAAAYNRGLTQLAAGKLTEGWRGYERRFDADETRRAAPAVAAPLWRGQSLVGKRLLVWAEQGVGDQILFAANIPGLSALAAAQGGRVVIAVEPRLVPLFRQSFPNVTVTADVDAAGAVDFHCGMGSLGPALRRRLADFPVDQTGYLHPDPTLAALWRDRLAALPPGLRVGLCWRSGLLNGQRRREYTELRAWRRLAATPGVALVNLTYGAAAEIAAAPDMRLHNWGDLDLKNDFCGVAALMSQLDLVVSAATAAGELAAAVGTPTWRFGLPGDWTCLGVGRARPWLPCQRIFHPKSGETLEDLADSIASRIAPMVGN